MKLPGWQPSISTAMPRKSPAIQGAPAMVKPAVQQFIPLDDPNDYMRLGRAQASKYESMGKVAVDFAGMLIQVKEVDDTNTANALVAKHAEDLARGQAELEMSKFSEVDANGNEVFAWKSAVDDFDQFTSAYKENVLSQHNFGSKGRAILEKGFSVNDKTFRSKTQKFVTDRTIDHAGAVAIAELDIAARNGNFGKIDEITYRTASNNTFDVTKSAELNLKYTEEAWAHKGTTAISSLRMLAPGTSKEQFDAHYGGIMSMLQSKGFGGSASTRRLLIKQAVDLRNDYEDRILGVNQDVAYSGALNRLAILVEGDNPVDTNNFFRDLDNPTAHEKLGAPNYMKMTELRYTLAVEGIDTDEGMSTLAMLNNDYRGGDIGDTTYYGDVVALKNAGKISNKAFSTALGNLSTMQEPRIKSQLGESRSRAYALLVGAQPNDPMNPDRAAEKAAAKSNAEMVVIRVEQEVRAAKDAGAPPPDIPMRTLQLSAEYFEMDSEYMLNSSGQPAKDMWDIDVKVSQDQINTRYAASVSVSEGRGGRSDIATRRAVIDRQDDLAALDSVVVMRKVVKPSE